MQRESILVEGEFRNSRNTTTKRIPYKEGNKLWKGKINMPVKRGENNSYRWVAWK